MAKEVVVKDEVVTENPATAVAHTCSPDCGCRKNNNRGLILAVASSLVLFLIGLILGYLIGNHSDRDYRSNGMMNSGNYRSIDRGRMPMHQQRSSSSAQGKTETDTNTTSPQTQAQ